MFLVGSLSGGLCLGGFCPGSLCQGDPLDRNPPERDPISCLVKSGRYTSYSNAFLFEILGVLEILNHLRRILLFRHYSSLEQEFYTNSLEKIPFGPCKERTIHFTDLTNSNTCVLDCTTVTVFGLLLQGFQQAPKLSTMWQSMTFLPISLNSEAPNVRSFAL